MNFATADSGISQIHAWAYPVDGGAPIFAGMTDHTMEARFEGATWHTMQTGAPVLDGALVAFDCRIEQIVEVGTHDIFICAVDAVEEGTLNDGLIYYARGYHRVIRA